MSDPIFVGTAVRLTATFRRKSNNELIDPGSITLSYGVENGTPTTLVYGTDAEVQRAGVGKYYADVSLDTPGTFFFSWVGTAPAEITNQASFQVNARRFA